MKLALFDIDGTLLNPNGAGRMAVESVLRQVTGLDGNLSELKFAGRTDTHIFTDGLMLLGAPPNQLPDLLANCFELLPEAMSGALSRRAPLLLPGIVRLLTLLEQSSLDTGLLTGNSRETAGLKLRAAGLDPEQFVVGAFGDEAAERDRLGALAIQRYHGLSGKPVSAAQVLMIGDTPADIQCGRLNGMVTVAVATGFHSYQRLADHEPDFLFRNFEAADLVLEQLWPGAKRKSDSRSA